jgi:hypothetical protein
MPFRNRVLLAFDAASVCAAVVRQGLWRTRTVTWATGGLSEGALVPSAFARNIQDPAVVGRAIREALEPLRVRASGVTLVLPHGVSRVAVLDVPRGHEPAEYARFRLAAGLPYPVTEAVVDFLGLGSGRVLVAAVRREVVEEYEGVSRSAGIRVGRIDVAPLAAAGGAGALAHGFEGPTVFVVLGDDACSLLAYDGGRLLGFRTRRRDRGSGEAERLYREALRTASRAGVFGEPSLVVAGAGARGVLDHWAAVGRGARLLSLVPEGGPLHEAATRPWLAAALT